MVLNIGVIGGEEVSEIRGKVIEDGPWIKWHSSILALHCAVMWRLRDDLRDGRDRLYVL